jgi:hypothetical protein
MFDEYDRAEDHVLRAIAVAEELGMGERVFFAESRLAEIRDQRRQSFEHALRLSEVVDCSPPVRATIDRLEDLAEMARG